MSSGPDAGWLGRDVWDVLRAATPTHLHLRNRLTTTLLVTILVDLLGSTAMLLAERGAASSGIRTFGDALYWTSSQLTTVSSTLANPVTGAGEVVAEALDVYAITVVATLAGVFGAFFHRRGEERHPLSGARPG